MHTSMKYQLQQIIIGWSSCQVSMFKPVQFMSNIIVKGDENNLQ